MVTFAPDVDDKRVRFRLIKRIEDVIGHVRQVFPKNKVKDTYDACSMLIANIGLHSILSLQELRWSNIDFASKD